MPFFPHGITVKLNNEKHKIIFEVEMLIKNCYHLLISRTGSINLNDIITMINKGIEFTRKNNTTGFILDLRSSILEISFIELYLLIKELTKRTNLNKADKFVIVVEDQFCKKHSRLAETVSSNWGQGIFKILCNYEFAIWWLNENKSTGCNCRKE